MNTTNPTPEQHDKCADICAEVLDGNAAPVLKLVRERDELLAIIGRIVTRVDRCQLYGPADSAREAIEEGREAIKL